MGFIGDFRDYLKTRSDCPPAFFAPAAMTALAVCAGNNCYVQGWSRPIYPNLWNIIIAPSGYGKSVPLDFVDYLLGHAQLGSLVLPNAGFSQEALLHLIQKQPRGVFLPQEFSAFVSGLDKQYNEGTTQWLTEAYDVPPTLRRILRDKASETGIQEIIIQRPTLSILGASSPGWLNEVFKDVNLRAGFYARFVFTPSTESGDYVAYPGPHNESFIQGMAGHLAQVADQWGEFEFRHLSQDFREWDERQRQYARSAEVKDEFRGIRSRAGALALKSAMIFALSRDPRHLRIERRDLELAFKHVEAAFYRTEQYLEHSVPKDKEDADVLAVIDYLKEHRRASRADILKALRCGTWRFDRALTTLTQREQVRSSRLSL
jgi:hypothetical protein